MAVIYFSSPSTYSEIFSAFFAAGKISEYVLGLEKQMTAMAPHREWIEEYDKTPEAIVRR